MPKTPELRVLPFASAAAFEKWLDAHHADTEGVWIRMARKASGIPSVTHEEALDVAICYGWIDGQGKSDDDTHFLQKFTPRRRASTWSKRNVDKVARLTAEGRMRPAGLAEVEAAKNDGRWEVAYDSPKDMKVPEDFMAAVAKNRKAREAFEQLGRSDLFAIGFRLHTAKRPETRRRRLESLVAMLERGEKPTAAARTRRS